MTTNFLAGMDGGEVQIDEKYKESLRKQLRKRKDRVFSSKDHFKFGAPMTVLQVIVGVPILYAWVSHTEPWKKEERRE